MNIMIVDDEKLLRNGFSHMTDWSLKGIHVVAEAINGADALDKIKKHHPDVVITDIKMPVMDGVELTKQIKTHYPEIEVIVLSSYDDYSFVRDSMKYGACDYLLKATIDIDEIYKALQQIKIRQTTTIQTTIDTDLSNSEKITFDLSIIKEYLEFHKFDKLKAYILKHLKSATNPPTSYLQYILRDLFFYIQYQLEQFGMINNLMKERKYVNSATVNLITNVETATEWMSTFIDELAKYCVPIEDEYNHKVKAIIEYIEANYALEGLSLSTIADHFFINKNYLCDIFKGETNTTINEYITNIRIEKAKELIRNTAFNSTQISSTVGYMNHSYFCRVFRKKTGLTPTEYMKLYRS